jgi:hypothetical protein
MRNVETGCGKVLVILSGIIIAMCAVALALYLARVFGLWPDWAIEAELVFRAAWKAWLR